MTLGITPHDDVKHWLAHPPAVWHCGMVPQSGIESWHGQSAALSAVIAVVMAQDLAIVLLATGANAMVRATRTARTVRNRGMMVTLRS